MNKINIFESTKQALKNNKFKLVPIIIATSIIGGCGHKQTSCKPIGSGIPYVTKFLDEFEQNENNFTLYSFEYENLGDNYYRIKKDYNNNIIYCSSLEEFKNYVDIKNPTLTDIKNVLADNSNINKEYKEWILEGIENLQKQVENLELVALYYNLKRMNIVERSKEEIAEKIGTLGAYFDISTGEVAIDPEGVTPYILCHEILGHAISDIEIISNETIIRYTPYCKVMCTELNAIDFNLGLSLEEGKANLISNIATASTRGGPYVAEEEQLRIFNTITNTSLEEFINSGVVELINNMRKNDINKPIDYINNVDQLLYAKREKKLMLPFEYTIEHNVVEFLKDYADDKITNGIDKEEIKTIVSETLDDSHYDAIMAGELFIIDFVSIDTLKQKSFNEIDKLDPKQLIK